MSRASRLRRIAKSRKEHRPKGNTDGNADVKTRGAYGSRHKRKSS